MLLIIKVIIKVQIFKWPFYKFFAMWRDIFQKWLGLLNAPLSKQNIFWEATFLLLIITLLNDDLQWCHTVSV